MSGFGGFSAGDFSDAAVMGQGYFPVSNDPGGSGPGPAFAQPRELPAEAAARIGSSIAGTSTGFRTPVRLLNFNIEYRDQNVNLKVPDSETVG